MKTTGRKLDRAVNRFQGQMEKTKDKLAKLIDELQDSADMMNACIYDVDEYLKEKGR